jgi:hypothetical protein
MDNAPGIRFVSLTFLIGFGIGAFAGVGLALLAVAITRPEDEEPTYIEIPALSSPTPAPTQPADTLEPAVLATEAMAVRVGPGAQYATLGTIARGDALDVIGRDFDSEWLAIRFPAGSSAQGWVPATGVEGLSFRNVEALAVLLPTPLPFDFATPPVLFGTPGIDLGTPGTETPDIDGTPDPLAGTADLAILQVSAEPDGRVSVVVANGGPAHITGGLLTITVRTPGGRFETLYHSNVFLAGTSVSFVTSSFTIGDSPESVQVVLDSSSSIDDPDRTNNVVLTSLTRPAEVVSTPDDPGPG